MNTDQEMISLGRAVRETGIPLATWQRWVLQDKVEGAARRPRNPDGGDTPANMQWLVPLEVARRMKQERSPDSKPKEQRAIEAARQTFDRVKAQQLRERVGLSRSETARTIGGGVSAAQVRHWELGNSLPVGQAALRYKKLLRQWEEEWGEEQMEPRGVKK